MEGGTASRQKVIHENQIKNNTVIGNSRLGVTGIEENTPEDCSELSKKAVTVCVSDTAAFALGIFKSSLEVRALSYFKYKPSTSKADPRSRTLRTQKNHQRTEDSICLKSRFPLSSANSLHQK